MPVERIIAFDIDNCLMPLNEPAREGVAADLQRLAVPGVRVVFASGKPCLYLAGLTRGLGLMGTSLIGENGAEVWLGCTMPPERLPQALTPEEQAGLQGLRQRVVTRYGDQVFLQPNTVTVTAFPLPGGPTPEEIAAEIGLDAPAGLHQYIHPDSVDWAVRRFDKGAALLLLAAHLGVPRSHLAAVGDSANDLPMIRVVDLPLWLGDPEELGDTPAVVLADIVAALARLQQWAAT